jgi:hypothetical protein
MNNNLFVLDFHPKYVSTWLLLFTKETDINARFWKLAAERDMQDNFLRKKVFKIYMVLILVTLCYRLHVKGKYISLWRE